MWMHYTILPIAKTTMAALLMSAVLTNPVFARDTVVGLSPHQEPDKLKEQVERVIQHLLKTVNAGESAHFIDASDARLIGSFAIPEGDAYKNPRARLQTNSELLRNLRKFMDEAETDLDVKGRADLPGFFRFVRENYPEGTGADMILFASPIDDNELTPHLTMRGGRVLEDGYISAPITASPFGTQGLSGSLYGYVIYFGLTSEVWVISTSHRYFVQRFWALSIEGHGGSLQYFDDDHETLFANAGEDAEDVQHEMPLVPTSKLEIIEFTRGYTGALPDFYSAPIEEKPAPEPTWRAANGVRVGLIWDDLEVDLDLYIRPSPDAPVIFYGQAQTEHGQLYKSFQNSPTTGFESVALNGAVDLSQMRMAINFYGGDAPDGVSGELRLVIGSQVWAKPLKITASEGNNGSGAETALTEDRAPNAGWVLIDPLELLGEY